MALIEVYEVSKAFPIELRHEVSLRHELTAVVTRMMRGADDGLNPFYALRDVSFSVERGEGFGIVGRNGAGKTTLLRIMANILEPSQGHVKIEGEYAALLGLGPGFNQDLTGEENLYLGGAFMGVRPAAIRELIGAIHAFSELGDFLHAPFKTYSAGMKARLGFSLILHTMPEIILVDEVIAVGDSAFQEKCFERLGTLIAQGRTVILVSHSTTVVRQICQRALWLDGGQVQRLGDVEDVLAAYEAHMHPAT